MELGADEWTTRFAARAGFPTGEVTVSEWDRGFPEGLTGPLPALRALWDEVLTRTPFRQLRALSATDEAVEDFVLWPRLERLTALGLTPEDGTAHAGWPPEPGVGLVTERAVAAVANCPALAGLETLTLDWFPLTDRAADLIVTSRYLKGLRRLRFYSAGYWTPQTDRVRERLEARFGAGVCGGRW
jgi:hypothetical protein